MGKTLAILFSIFLLLTIIAFQVSSSINLNNGHWVYPLDDTYIHMSIGKNLAQHGQWGITKYEFSSSSSSILYTLLMAITMKITGVSENTPLVLNIFIGLLVFAAIWRISAKENFDPVVVMLIGVLLIFLTPLPALIISGMEHTLQILIDLCFLYLAARAIESRSFGQKYFFHILCFATLTVMIRFEGLFIIGIVSFLFLLKRDLKYASCVFLCGVLPMIIFGIYSVFHGAYFIPNSLLMKGEKPSMNLHGLIKFAFGWLDKLKHNPHLLTLFIGLCAYYLHLTLRRVSFFHRTSIITLTLIFTLIIHLTLAKTGWFFRYEAYLVFLGIFAFTWFIHDSFRGFNFSLSSLSVYVPFFLILCAGLYPLYSRGKAAFTMTVPATKNIYEQQYQMAAFLKKYYNTASVGANDIGAICFFTDIKLFDVFGLGSKEIIDLRIKKLFDKEHIYEISKKKGTQIVVIYEDWFIDKVPNQWLKVGSWKIPDNVILGGEVVSFFATEKYDPGLLKDNLFNFAPDLPKGVQVKYTK